MYQLSKAKKNLEEMKRLPFLSVKEIGLIDETHHLLELADQKLEEKAEQYCYWNQQDSETSEDWLACHNKLFCLNNGTPTENGMLFCPYCGKNLIAITYQEFIQAASELLRDGEEDV